LVALLAAVPLLAVLGAVLAPGTSGWVHLSETMLWRYVSNSLALMAIAGLTASVLGVSTAWLVAVCDFPARRLFSWALVLPLAAPAYIVAYVYADILAFSGPVQSGLRALTGWEAGQYWFPPMRSLPMAGLLFGLVLYPYVYLLMRASFSLQSGAQFLAARSLGSGPLAAFWRVSLPVARPALAGGLALVLMETLADFGVAEYFAIPTLSTGIFRTWLGLGERVAALKLAGVMLAVVAVLIMIEWLSRPGRLAGPARTGARLEPMRLSALHGVLAWCVCGLPIVLGFIIPVVALGNMALEQMGGAGAAFWASVINSLSVAALAAFIAAAIALGLAYAQRASVSLVTKFSIRLATLGYALPGALLAVGLLAPLGAVDRSLTGWAQDSFGWGGGLILTGSIAVLVYACVVRFLTVAFNSVASTLERVAPELDEVARTLGVSGWSLLRRVHMPMISTGLLAGLLLVFVDTMRELPATLILRPFNFDTLATRVYWLASDERLGEACLAALTIMVIGIIPILLIDRLTDRRDL
jgi:iron(III) transport system permease protein